MRPWLGSASTPVGSLSNPTDVSVATLRRVGSTRTTLGFLTLKFVAMDCW